MGFVVKLLATVGPSILGALLNRRRGGQRLTSQRPPPEIETEGLAAYDALYAMGEAPSPFLEAKVCIGTTTTTYTDPPFSAQDPGEGQVLDVAWYVASEALHSPVGLEVDGDIFSIAVPQPLGATGARIVNASIASDGSHVWNIAASHGGRATFRFNFKADGSQGADLRTAAAATGYQGTPWTTDHKLNGCAWIHATFREEPSSEAHNRSRTWQAGRVPRVRVIVRGGSRAIPSTGGRSTWPVRFTRSAVAAQLWLQEQGRGRDRSLLDGASWRRSQNRAQQGIVIDAATALQNVRYAYAHNPNETAPAAPGGNSYPPGGTKWGVVRLSPQKGNAVWICDQVRSGTTWSPWRNVRRLRAWGGGGDGGPDDRPERERETAMYTRVIQENGRRVVRPTPDEDPEVIRPGRGDDEDIEIDARPEPDPTEPDDQDEDPDDKIVVPPRTRDNYTDWIDTFSGDRSFQLYEVNGFVSGSDLTGRIDGLQAEFDWCMAGHVVDSAGRVVCVAGEDSPPAALFDDSTGETISTDGGLRARDRINSISMKLAASRRALYREYAMPILGDLPAIDRDGREIVRDLGTRGFTTSPTHADMLSTIALRRERRYRTILRRERIGNDAATLKVRAGDRVVVRDDARGISPVSSTGPNKRLGSDQGRYYRVESRRVNTSDFTIDFLLQEAPNGIHSPIPKRFPALAPNVSHPDAQAGAVLDFRLVEEAFLQDDGSIGTRCLARWRDTAGGSTRVRFRINLVANVDLQQYEEVVIGGTAEVPTSSIVTRRGPYLTPWQTKDAGNETEVELIPQGIVGSRIEAQARRVSVSGITSAWSSSAFRVIQGDTSAPAAPTNVTTTPQTGDYLIEHDLPTESDYALTQVYDMRGSSDDDSPPMGAGLRASYRGTSGVVILGGSRRPGTGTAWIRHLDLSGNPKSLTEGWTRVDDVEQYGPDNYETFNDHVWALTTSADTEPVAPTDPSSTASRIFPDTDTTNTHRWGAVRTASRSGDGLLLNWSSWSEWVPWGCHETVNPSGRFIVQIQVERRSRAADGTYREVLDGDGVSEDFPFYDVRLRQRTSTTASWQAWGPWRLIRILVDDVLYDGIFARYEQLQRGQESTTDPITTPMGTWSDWTDEGDISTTNNPFTNDMDDSVGVVSTFAALVGAGMGQAYMILNATDTPSPVPSRNGWMALRPTIGSPRLQIVWDGGTGIPYFSSNNGTTWQQWSSSNQPAGFDGAWYQGTLGDLSDNLARFWWHLDVDDEPQTMLAANSGRGVIVRNGNTQHCIIYYGSALLRWFSRTLT